MRNDKAKFRVCFLIDDPFLGGSMGSNNVQSTMMSDNLFQQNPSRASRSISTTTSIVNGHKHTVTKIQDVNGIKIIEDYGNGRQRVTVNGIEQSVEKPAAPEHYIKNTPVTTKPVTSQVPYNNGKMRYRVRCIICLRDFFLVEQNREYGDVHHHDEENQTTKRKSPLHELCSRLFCGCC